MGIEIPDGWTFQDTRDFIQSELNEDRPGRATMADISEIDYVYYDLRDFDRESVIFTVDWDTLYRIAANLVVTDAGKDMEWVGDPMEVAKKTTYVPVAELAESERRHTARFSAHTLASDAITVGDFVTRTGTVFETGDYPTQARQLGLEKLVFTPDDLRTMVQNFKPVPNRVNHVTGPGPNLTPSYFDNHMGELTALEVAEDGTRLIGTVQIPRWFDDFHRAHYPDQPLKNSLEIDIRSMAPIGNTLLPNPQVSSSALMGALASFAAKGSSGNQPVKERRMAEQNPGNGTPQAVSFAEHQALQAQLASQTAQITQMQEQMRRDKSAAFAEKVIASGRVIPAIREQLIGLWATADADDAARGGTVTFAATDGTQTTGTRTQALEAAFEALPVLPLTRDLTDGATHIVMPSTFSDADASKDHQEAIAAARANAEKQRDAMAANRNGR